MEKYFNELIKKSTHTAAIISIKEGTLVSKDGAIYVNDDNKIHYLAHVDYAIHGNKRNNICNNFVKLYSYADIRKEYLKEVDRKNKLVEGAENTKYILIDLKEDIENILSNLCSVELLANNHLIKYYLEIKYKHICILEIYLNDDTFKCRYNYNDIDLVAKNDILNFINDTIMPTIKEDIEKEKIKHEECRKEQDKKNKFSNFIYDNIDKTILLKLKNSVVCYKSGTRFAIGKGKEGKFYNCNLRDFIEGKSINEYIIIEDSGIYSRYTNKEFKQLDWQNIV